MKTVVKNMLKTVADLVVLPTNGAFNIRVNGSCAERHSTKNVQIIPKENGSEMCIRDRLCAYRPQLFLQP